MRLVDVMERDMELMDYMDDLIDQGIDPNAFLLGKVNMSAQILRETGETLAQNIAEQQDEAERIEEGYFEDLEAIDLLAIKQASIADLETHLQELEIRGNELTTEILNMKKVIADKEAEIKRLRGISDQFHNAPPQPNGDYNELYRWGDRLAKGIGRETARRAAQ